MTVVIVILVVLLLLAFPIGFALSIWLRGRK